MCLSMTRKKAAPVFKIAQNIKYQRRIAKIIEQKETYHITKGYLLEYETMEIMIKREKNIRRTI